MRRVPLYHWLATLPGLLILLGVPFANRVEARVLGMPFLLAWIVGCVLLTSLVMAIVGRLDDERTRRDPPPTDPGRKP